MNKLAPKLREPGIDSDIVAEKICELIQKRKDQIIVILGNITIQSRTYLINQEGILELQTKHIQNQYNEDKEFKKTPKAKAIKERKLERKKKGKLK